MALGARNTISILPNFAIIGGVFSGEIPETGKFLWERNSCFIPCHVENGKIVYGAPVSRIALYSFEKPFFFKTNVCFDSCYFGEDTEF